MKSWRITSNLLGLRLVQLLGVSAGSHVLDVRTGDGSALIASLQSVGPTGYVVSLDNDQGSVEYVSKELRKLSVHNAEVRLSDGKHIDIPDSQFDFAVSGFMSWDYCFDFTKNVFHSPDLVMNEIYRILKSGGGLGISTWLFQEDMDWMEQFIESYDCDSRRVYSMESEEAWQVIMESSPFNEFTLLPEKIEYTFDSLDDWWDEMNRLGWHQQIEEISDLTEVSLERIKVEAFERIGARSSASNLIFSRKALFIIASKT